MADEFAIDSRQARRSFQAAAQQYDAAAVLQREVGQRILTRLDYIRVEPDRVLDLGAGTGYFAEKLLQRYSRAGVIAVDFAHAMTRAAAKRGRWRRRPSSVCATASALPFSAQTFDLIFSNLMLQWCQPLSVYFAEMRRLLKPGGVLMFSTFGPDTLKELRGAWAVVDEYPHVHEFSDMHDIGDAMLAAGFADPVVDMELLTVTYADVLTLLRDLKSIGARNAAQGRARGLLGRQRYAQLCAAYEQFRSAEGRLPASWEIIYGHAWGPQNLPPNDTGHKVFPIHVTS